MSDLDQMIQMLKSSKKDERTRAVISIGRLSDPPQAAIDGLVAATGDRVAEVRANAAKALGQLRRGGEGVVSVLIALLLDKDQGVSDSAVVAIGCFGSVAQAAIVPLGSALPRWAGRARVTSRIVTIATLEKIGNSAREIAIALDDEELMVRRAAIEALATFADVPNDILGALIEKLRDPDTEAKAAKALGGHPEAADRIVPALIACWERNKYPPPAVTASLLLMGTSVYSEMVRALKSRNLSVRLGAESVLLTLDPASDVPGELFEAICSTDAEIAIKAIVGLKSLPLNARIRAIPWLARVTAVPHVGQWASLELGALGRAAEPARQSLLEAMLSPLEYIRRFATDALKLIEGGGAQAAASPEVGKPHGGAMFVQAMLADNQSQGQPRSVAVTAWDSVAEAIRRLDGKKYTSIMLQSQAADHMHIIGGASGLDAVYSMALYNCSGARGSRHFVLIDSQKPSDAEVQLNCEGTPTDTPLSATVSLEEAMRAAKSFCIDGTLDSSMTWSEQG